MASRSQHTKAVAKRQFVNFKSMTFPIQSELFHWKPWFEPTTLTPRIKFIAPRNPWLTRFAPINVKRLLLIHHRHSWRKNRSTMCLEHIWPIQGIPFQLMSLRWNFRPRGSESGTAPAVREDNVAVNIACEKNRRCFCLVGQEMWMALITQFCRS